MVGEVTPETDWSLAVDGIDAVVHLAARVHVMHDSNSDAYDRVNVGGSRTLAEKAAVAGVKRLVFVSSIKAMGEATLADRPWREEDRCCPEDSYGKSKLAAELALAEVAVRTKMEVVILRSPVVYGPSVGANIYSLFRVIDRGWPLPFGSVRNRRSFIFVGNLVDAIVRVLDDSKAANETFLVSDGEDLSTPELIRATACALGKPACLFPSPPMLLRVAGQIVGKSAELDRLLCSLVIDSSKIRRLLGWRPPFGMQEGLAKTAEWYKVARKRNGDSS